MSGTVSSLGSAQIKSEIATVQARLQAPITLLQTQQATEKADISAWGTIKGAVSSLSGALSGLSNITALASRSVNSTSSGVATATAANSAAVGVYSVTDVKLAKAQAIYSGVYGSAAKVGSGAGSLVFTQNGKTETVTVASGSRTVGGIAAAINKIAGGVQASVVNTQGGARLVLQSGATGSSQAFTLKGIGGLSNFAYTPSAAGSFTSTSSAKNATLKINGVPVSHSSNTVSSAVSGLTINLAASSPSSSTGTTIKVSNSPAALTSAVSSVASTLSAAIASIAAQTRYVPASSANAASATSTQVGPLIGNFTATNLQSQLLTAVSGAAASGVTSNTIGLTVTSTGAVSFDASTFNSAFAGNPGAVQKLVASIYNTLKSTASSTLGSGNTVGGTIVAQTSSLTSQISSVNKQVAQLSKFNNEQLQILVQEYSIAESMATSAQTTQAYLSIFTNTGSGSKKG
ncbi:MAG: flagellar filament capping protein FliD [Proteobacteria bacterium]|nr:flagellar filament capping protein FliD [Pseudomonadota bacterium]